MAHPWVFEENFEGGTKGNFDTETDTGSALDFPHYSELARHGMAPYRGAYCVRINSSDTNDHTLTEGDIDISDGGTDHFRFHLYFGNDFAFSADDVVNIFELQQAGGTVESSLGLNLTNSTDTIQIGVGDGTAPSSYSSDPLHRNRWYTVELSAKISTGGAGTLTLYIDGVSRVALTSLTNAAAVGQGVLGLQNQLATTTGTILLDDFVMDDARIYPHRERYPTNLILTKTTTAFVGPGSLESIAQLKTSDGDETLKLYDTDVANADDGQSQVAECDVFTAIDGPIQFKRGCYAVLAGTDPRFQLNMLVNSDRPSMHGPLCYSHRGTINHGLRRKGRSYGT